MDFHCHHSPRWAVLLICVGLVQQALSAAFDAERPANSPGASAEGKSSAVENSVVQVFSTVRYPDPFKPWTKLAPSQLNGSGVVIDGKRILTCAHVVLYSSQVEIQANQAGDKVSASVEAVAPGIDLAVLKLDDQAFFDSHPALSRASTLPAIKEAVMAYGYPKGGSTLSITKGIVSRIEFATYNFPVNGLRIQIDAAINAGNSGGPAVVGDKMIGLAFSHLGNAENIGYIIPCEEIELFLQDFADGHHDGKPMLFDECQTLENPTLRSFLKVDKAVEGLVVHKPERDEAGYPLKQWDIITTIGDSPLDDQGMIKAGGNLRLNAEYMVQKIAKDGKVPLTIVRGGKELRVQMPVSPEYPLVIPPLRGTYPAYFVYGPLSFSSASAEFVSSLGRGSSGSTVAALLMRSGSPLLKRMVDKPAFPGEGLVVISSPFFPHKLCKGYANPMGAVVKSVNGKAIRNLGHLVEVLRDSKEEFITIEFDGRNSETLVFPRAEMVAATDGILTDNGVRSQGSADMLAIWNGKSPTGAR